jgi:hypothetical protein
MWLNPSPPCAHHAADLWRVASASLVQFLRGACSRELVGTPHVPWNMPGQTQRATQQAYPVILHSCLTVFAACSAVAPLLPALLP